ncbi:MAG TPA: hypothetical protein P5528_15945 [Steroidobacteraceae bacterium]|nr:hypothetical protein [Steroidobacteraceae bacterium]HRX90932.1 hypothetical protein [Steroidobacteraceae bacterium]
MSPRAVVMWLLVSAMALPIAAGSKADESVLAELGRCQARLDPIVDVGYARIVQRCPKLPDLIAAASWQALLPPAWQARSDSLSVGSLAALAVLARDAEAGAPIRSKPDLGALAAALGPFDSGADESLGRWQRFKRWLGQLFGADEANDTDWLARFSGSFKFSEALSRALTTLGYLVLFGFVIFIIAGELHAAGLLTSRRRRATAQGVPVRGARQAGALGDVARLPLPDRPGALLQLVVDRLVVLRGRVPWRSLTIREIQAVINREPVLPASQLLKLGHTAEQVLFAKELPAPETLDAAERAGRQVLESLAQPSALPST